MKHRTPVNKQASARKFKSQVGRTKKINFAAGPMRGGIRL